jgi:Arabinose-binding domain of AraC transcription regulator, N-term
MTQSGSSLFDLNQIRSSRLQLSSIQFYRTSSKLRSAKPMRSRPRFSSIPTASGAITRAAYARAVGAGVDVGPVFKACGLTVRQVENPNFRIAVKNQIKFLNLVAGALSDEFLGVHLAESVDLRALG